MDGPGGQHGTAGTRDGESWSRAGWQAHLPGVADVAARVGELAGHTIPELVAASVERSPGKTAVTFDGTPVRYAEVDSESAAVAAWLRGRVGPGDRVLLAAGTSAGFLRCYLGTLRAGAVAVLASPAYTAAELAHLVSDSGARLAFADAGPARLLAGLREPPLVASVHELPGRRGGPAGGEMGGAPSGVALLAYTSGTTGRPKGVPLTHRQLLASIRPAMAAWHWTGDDVAVHALPLFHQHGLGGLQASLIAGGTAHLQARFDPGRLLAAVRATRASVLLGVPTMYQALLQAEQESPPAGLRLAVCGSAPLSPGLARRLPAVLGRLPLVRYGTTETGLNVSHTLGEAPPGGTPGGDAGGGGSAGRDAPGASTPGGGTPGGGVPDGPHPDTVGVPLPGVLARVWAGEAEAPPGTDGEIQLRGPGVFGGYWRQPAATSSAFAPGGWFRTGDIGVVDPATGHLKILGRTKEMIISGGLNVYPREVEIVLEGHPSVAEAAVAGIPHERWGEQVTAWVVVRPGHEFDERQLIGHARAALAAYKCPKQIFRAAALPRTPAGKIQRSALVTGFRGPAV